MSSEFVFIFCKSVTCIHCANFYKEWPTVNKNIKTKYQNINTIVLTRGEGFIPNLISTKYNGWNPMFLLMKKNTWNSLILGQINNFNEIKVLNGIYDNDGKVVLSNKYKTDFKTAIMSFLNDEMIDLVNNPEILKPKQIISINDSSDLLDYNFNPRICKKKMNIISKH